MNLTLKSEKQEMNYLNYSNALWDCFAFHILGNVAWLGDRSGLVKKKTFII